MKLRTKLLLGVGILLFLMLLIMFVIPSYFIRKDIHHTADQIQELLFEEQERLVANQQLWLTDALQDAKENNDSLLLMLYETPQMSEALVFDSNQTEEQMWRALARLIGYDPGIDFVQAHSPTLKKSALISSSMTTLYSLNMTPSEENTLVTLFNPEGVKQKNQYIAYPLPHSKENDKGYIFYALLDPKEVDDQISILEKQIDKLSPEFLKKEFSQSNPSFVAGDQAEKPAFVWATKVNLMRSLVLFYRENLAINQNDSSQIPMGIVRLDSSGNGYAVLTKEVFSTQIIFNDKEYFEAHRPLEEGSPLAEGAVMITKEPEHQSFIGNTLLLQETFLSIGKALNFLPRQLALSTNSIVLLQVNKNFWMGYEGQGKQIPPNLIQEIVDSHVLKKKNGRIHLNQKEYSFSQFISLEEGNIILFDLHPIDSEQNITASLFSLGERLTKRISTQLSLISLGTMILVLSFIGRLGWTVIAPITKLAACTQAIVAGKYEEVSLPDMGNRKDEVATLIRSFKEMVRGLKDREKIRGVLDKVVSKDVADEILRTQIHLGGEDRIVTMLFCDIRGFSTLTAHLSPQKTIQLLNACMTKVSRVIEGEGGVIDKYVGDEVMALFGAPTEHPDHALRAVSTGMLIVETLKKWNRARVAAGEKIIFEMGIGIHTGLVVAGNMGAEDRLNYTVLGANVNLSARLCAVAKPNQLIISEATLNEPKIQDFFYTKPLDPITLKGFTESVKVFEIIGFKWEE